MANGRPSASRETRSGSGVSIEASCLHGWSRNRVLTDHFALTSLHIDAREATGQRIRLGWCMLRPSSISERPMLYFKPSAFACIGLAAAAPLILHGHASPDCNP